GGSRLLSADKDGCNGVGKFPGRKKLIRTDDKISQDRKHHMASAETEIIIEAGHTERNYWRDLFRYRELFYFLAWRDILVRYKQTVIGVLWAVLRPFLTMVVFVFIFGRIAKLPSDGVPYPVMVFAAMLPWQ